MSADAPHSPMPPDDPTGATDEREPRVQWPTKVVVTLLLSALLGALLPLWGTYVMLYRTGAAPSATVTREGWAQVSTCRRSWSTLQACEATVEWAGQPGTHQVVVLSREPLTGRVAVEEHTTVISLQTDDAVDVIPAGQPSGRGAAGVVGVGLLATVVGLVFGMSLGGRWLRHRGWVPVNSR